MYCIKVVEWRFDVHWVCVGTGDANILCMEFKGSNSKGSQTFCLSHQFKGSFRRSGSIFMVILEFLTPINSYGHISQITLDPVRSPKLSCEEPS
jgi:hypothetical protein